MWKSDFSNYRTKIWQFLNVTPYLSDIDLCIRHSMLKFSLEKKCVSATISTSMRKKIWIFCVDFIISKDFYSNHSSNQITIMINQT